VSWGDAQLDSAIRAAKAGSDDAISYLYCRYADYVRRYLTRMLVHEAEVEAATQYVFAEVFSTIARDETPFEARLLQLARRAAHAAVEQRPSGPERDSPAGPLRVVRCDSASWHPGR
jgi:DNA-directed RNA polymerase specialized sigma24 family protein